MHYVPKSTLLVSFRNIADMQQKAVISVVSQILLAALLHSLWYTHRGKHIGVFHRYNATDFMTVD